MMLVVTNFWRVVRGRTERASGWLRCFRQTFRWDRLGHKTKDRSDREVETMPGIATCTDTLPPERSAVLVVSQLTPNGTPDLFSL